MIEVPDFSRLRQAVNGAGHPTPELVQQLQKLIDAIRELQETAEDHEDRITDLE